MAHLTHIDVGPKQGKSITRCDPNDVGDGLPPYPALDVDEDPSPDLRIFDIHEKEGQQPPRPVLGSPAEAGSGGSSAEVEQGEPSAEEGHRESFAAVERPPSEDAWKFPSKEKSMAECDDSSRSRVLYTEELPSADIWTVDTEEGWAGNPSQETQAPGFNIPGQTTRVKQDSRYGVLDDQFFQKCCKDGIFKYFVGELLGKGFAGKSYVAYTDEPYQEEFLIKKIAKEDFQQSEVNIMARLNHPNVVKFYGILEFDNHYGILMERIKGATLCERRRTEKLDLKSFLLFFWKMLLTVSYLHKEGIIHGDIHEGNLMVIETTDEIKLLDFGWSTLLDPKDDNRHNLKRNPLERLGVKMVYRLKEWFRLGFSTLLDPKDDINRQNLERHLLKRRDVKMATYCLMEWLGLKFEVPEEPQGEITKEVIDLLKSGTRGDPAADLLKHRAFNIIGKSVAEGDDSSPSRVLDVEEVPSADIPTDDTPKEGWAGNSPQETQAPGFNTPGPTTKTCYEHGRMECSVHELLREGSEGNLHRQLK